MPKTKIHPPDLWIFDPFFVLKAIIPPPKAKDPIITWAMRFNSNKSICHQLIVARNNLKDPATIELTSIWIKKKLRIEIIKLMNNLILNADS